MILQSLTQYYTRLVKEEKVPILGFQEKPIPYIIVLDEKGRFRGLTDTTSKEAKRGISRIVPREIVRPGQNAWQKANFLWDNPAYVLGYSADNPADAQRKHESFLSKIKQYFPIPQTEPGVNAVVTFLERRDFSGIYDHSSWKDISESGGNITFQIEGDGLVCQRDAVVKAVLTHESQSSGQNIQCLVSGEPDIAVVTTGKIKGVKDAQSTGANIVSFNLKAFNSYGKEQGLNAPIGTKAEFAFSTALNTMLAGRKQRLLVGDSTTVFWAEKKNDIEDVFADLFGERANENPEQINQAITTLYKSPRSGAPPIEEDYTRFFVLGLAPNAARIAVRFWHAGTVGETARHIRQHFDDCAIVHAPKQPQYLSLYSMLIATAALSKPENIPPNLAGDVMKSILDGTPYPRSLLNAVITRTKAEQSRKDSRTGKVIQNVSYPRAALIKALLAREVRCRNAQTKEVGMSLDINNNNPGYLLGRLFAVLEKVQIDSAGGENKINATIRDRYYGSASSTPVAVFSRLMKLKNHHLAKLEKYKNFYEKLIGEITDKLSADNAFPAHLPLDDQGRFAVGYYHQRQDFFTKKSTDTSKEA